MSIGILRRTVLGLMLGVLLGNTFSARGQGEGIFAEFNTSMGSFTCRLEYAYAPKAVANFIGLATGERAWMDLNTGAIRNEPYYDGITFHRVLKDFVIQSGSRNGQGTDSPGYVFVDEFTPNLRYGGTGVLGMANPGTNANGAQFFLTVGAQSNLNDHYTIFGELTGGTNVVLDINRVGTGFFDDKPTNNIILRNVVIRRVGAAAEAFDINAQGLPVVTGEPLVIAKPVSNQFALSFTNRASTENFLFSTTNFYVPGLFTNIVALTNYFYNYTSLSNYTTSNVVSGVTNWVTNSVTVTNEALQTLYETNTYTTNLAAWKMESLGIEVPNAPFTNTFYRTRTNASGYFRLAQIHYTGIYVPREVKNRTLTLNFDDGLGTMVINFNNANGGSYTPPPGEAPGTVKSYTWSQDYFQGSLDPIKFSTILPMSLQMFFNDSAGGVFSGTVNSDAPFPVSGNFTLSPGS